ncbi:beta-lactoglobulin-like [Myotis daubentonii]|uniref:beta-lactoglobulin-like n=1 Tax=Myotis daubentonii TaxID=98922 RepID=UPI002872B775|nr:beta-lactoglobulin-like [Myotis daubentonii]
MRCLLLALSVALVCGTQDIFVPQTGEDLDVQKVAGTWYSMAMAASDLALLSTQNAPLRMYVKELRPTPQGDLEIMVHRWEDGSCVQGKIFGEKTGVPAEFKINSLGDSKAHVLDTDYETYAFLCLENAAPAKQSLACQYLARTPKVDQVAMEQFGRAMRLLPIHIQMVFTPAQAEERCRV